MKRTKILTTCEKLIQSADFSKSNRFHLCLTNDKLCCLPDHHAGESHPIFYVFNEEARRWGLSPKGWTLLEARIAIHEGRMKL